MPDELSGDAIRQMTPQEAGAELERRTAAFKASQAPTANDAQTRLERFVDDPGNAAKLFAGDPNITRQFHDLATAAASSDGSDKVGEAIAGKTFGDPAHGELTVDGSLTRHDTQSAVNALRDLGVEDGAISEAFTGLPPGGQKYDAATIATVRAFKAKCEGDPEWVRALFAGGYEQKRQLALWSIVLSNA
jgi:hypothetical protein